MAGDRRPARRSSTRATKRCSRSTSCSNACSSTRAAASPRAASPTARSRDRWSPAPRTRTRPNARSATSTSSSPGSRFDEAIALLTAAGGRARYREPRPNFTARFGKGVCVVTTEGLEIDVHRTFVAGPFGLAIDAHDLFAAPETIDIGGVAIPVPQRGGPVPPRVLSHRAHQPAHHRVARRRADRRPRRTSTSTRRSSSLARWRGRAVVQRALALTRTRLPADLAGPLYAWAERYRPDRFETTALRSYTTEGSSYAGQMATGVWALRGVRAARRVRCRAARAGPHATSRNAKGSYVRRWARALDASCVRREALRDRRRSARSTSCSRSRPRTRRCRKSSNHVYDRAASPGRQRPRSSRCSNAAPTRRRSSLFENDDGCSRRATKRSRSRTSSGR